MILDTMPYTPQSVTHAVAMAANRGRIVVAGIEAERAFQTLSGAFPEEQAIHAIVPQQA